MGESGFSASERRQKQASQPGEFNYLPCDWLSFLKHMISTAELPDYYDHLRHKNQCRYILHYTLTAYYPVLMLMTHLRL